MSKTVQEIAKKYKNRCTINRITLTEANDWLRELGVEKYRILRIKLGHTPQEEIYGVYFDSTEDQIAFKLKFRV